MGEAFGEPVLTSWCHQRGGQDSWKWPLLLPLLRGVWQGRAASAGVLGKAPLV